MRIGVLTQWYDPEPGPAALPGVMARELARRGHDVHVLTGFPNYPTGRVAEGYRQRVRQREVLDGVTVHRVPLYAHHGSSGVHRLLNYGSFGVTAATLGVAGLPRLDALWVNYSPVTVAPAMWLTQLVHGTPTVCEVGDLWPDTMLVAGLTGSSTLLRFGGSALDRWVQSMYRSSDAVVAISPGVLPLLRSRDVAASKLHYIPKPADEAIFKPGGVSLREQYGLGADDIVVTYAGAMGAAQSLSSVVAAVARATDPRLKLVLAGSGTEEDSLKALAVGDDRIQFVGRIPHESMTDFLATGDVALVSLASHPSSAYTMPSKVQSTLAAGRGLLGVLEGDAADLITSRRVGVVARPDDPSGIDQALGSLLELGRPGLARLGVRARETYEAEFSVALTTDRIEALLREVSERTRRGVARLTPADGPRVAGPTITTGLRRDDVPIVAAIHREAFPSFFLSSLGQPFLEVFYRSFLDYPDGLVVVARDQAGAPVGIAVGTLSPHGFFRRSLKKHLLGYFLASARAAVQNPRVASRLWDAFFSGGDGIAHADGALFSSLCISPKAAGQGTGRELIRAFLDETRSRGASRVFLTTDAEGNDRINKIYRQGGWKLHDDFVTKQGRRMNRYVYDFEDQPVAD